MTDRRRLATALVALFVATAAAAGLGIPVRASYGAHVTGDEPQYLLTAISLAEDGNLDIADELADRRWRAFHEVTLPQQTRPLPDGRRVSPHDPLLPVVLAAPVAIGGWVAAKLTMALLAGVLAAAMAWVAVRRFDVDVAIAGPVVGVFTVTAPLAVYGQQIYPELPAAIAVTAAIAALTGPLRRGGVWLLVASVTALPWLAIKYTPVAAVLAVIGLARLWRLGRHGLVTAAVTALAAGAVVYAVVHLQIWTGLTPYASGDHFVDGELTAVGHAPNYLGRSRRLLGLLVDRHFGLAAWQPAYLLAVPAVAWVWRRQTPGLTALLAPLAAGWLTATFVALTMHGFWFPGRQVVVVLPALVLLVAAAAASSAVLRRCVLVAGAAGIWTYAWLIAAGLQRQITWVVDFFAVADPWYRAWSRLLPPYIQPFQAPWAAQAAWLVALGIAVWMTWRHAGPR